MEPSMLHELLIEVAGVFIKSGKKCWLSSQEWQDSGEVLRQPGDLQFAPLGSFLAHLSEGTEDFISIMATEQLHAKSNVAELLAQAQKPAMERGVIAPIE
jgi:hypothetical protein